MCVQPYKADEMKDDDLDVRGSSKQGSVNRRRGNKKGLLDTASEDNVDANSMTI